MGILNATPDSFSGDGLMDTEALIQRGKHMVASGADMLDVGGESSRPFSDSIGEDEEIRRVIPVIRELKKCLDVPVSIDTCHFSVANAAIQEGAAIINDISGLRDMKMMKLVEESQVDVVIMHMQNNPKTMQINPIYEDIVSSILKFFKHQINQCLENGIDKNQIILDPGIGFGKLLQHNLQILKHIDQFKSLGYPVLIGPSRKSFIGDILDLPEDQRLEGTLAAVASGVIHGVDIVRVHDVPEVARFLSVFEELSLRN